MSTKCTKFWWHVRGWGVHCFRDTIDQRTYLGIGSWEHEITVQWPRVWRLRPPPSWLPRRRRWWQRS